MYFTDMKQDHPQFDRQMELIALLPRGEKSAARLTHLSEDLYGDTTSSDRVYQLAKITTKVHGSASIRESRTPDGEITLFLGNTSARRLQRHAETYIQLVYGE